MVRMALLLSSLRYCAMSNVLAMLNSHFVLWHFQRTKANTPPHTVLRSLLYNPCVSFSNNANIFIIHVEAIYFGKICQVERQIQTSIRWKQIRICYYSFWLLWLMRGPCWTQKVRPSPGVFMHFFKDVLSPLLLTGILQMRHLRRNTTCGQQKRQF